MTLTAEHSPFLARFRELERSLASDGPDWLRAVRRTGLERFESTGLPDGRTEAWRSTPVAPIAGGEFVPAGEPASGTALPDEVARLLPDGPRLVLVDGRLDAGSSSLDGLPAGVWAGGLAAALDEHPDAVRSALETAAGDPGTAPAPFLAINQAFLRDGAVLLVDEGAEIDEPVAVVHLTRGAAAPVLASPHLLVVAAPSSRLPLLEVHAGIGTEGYLAAPAADVTVGRNAHVDHLRLQMESAAGLHVSSSCARLGRDARYDSCAVTLGGRLVRNEVRAVLQDEGAHCRLWGLTLTRGREHVDNFTTLEHAAPHCDSRELYKSILDGRSRTVFTGRIIVRQDAQQTDAKQSNPNLLLSPDALAHTRPQLEIYADDVKCTHGATIGRLDEDALFYLRSRGIAADDARDLLIHAFAGEILDRIESETVRQAVTRAVDRRLPGGEGAE